MYIQGTVGAPSNVSAVDGSNPNVLQGKAAELVVAELHGKWYTSAYRGRVFQTGVLIAGVTIPVNTTTSPTFTLFNPLGSGVNLELISLDVGWPAAAASVVGTLLGTTGVQAPTATTAGNIYSTLIGGGGVPQAKFYTAATIVAITQHMPLITMSTVTDTMNPAHVDFDGRIILAPGSLFTLTSTPVQTAVALPALSWAEYPV